MTEELKPAGNKLEAMIRLKLAEGMELVEAVDWLARYRQKEVVEAILESVRGTLH